THDKASCRLCLVLAAGATETRNGNGIPPYCAFCDGHHFADYHVAPKDRSLCPRCREARRELVTIYGRTAYGSYCYDCYEAEGYIHKDGVIYKPSEVHDACPDEDIFDMNGPTKGDPLPAEEWRLA